MKKCTKCGKVRPDSDYTWSIRGVKKHSACNSCRAEERKEYYARHKERELVYKANRQISKREEARKYVFEYLSKSKCQMCGESDPLVLTFHHLKDKKMDVSQMVNQGYSMDAIKKELAKCIVLCANDHMRIEKQKRRTTYSA